MRIRAFATTLLAALLLVVAPTPELAADTRPADVGDVVAASPDEDDTTRDDTTRPTVNEFMPELRPLSDCLGALQRPNCGSEARGGWEQTTVFLAIVAGLSFIAWRIVASSRRARRRAPGGPVTSGTPDATSARDGDGGVPAP